MTMETTLAVGWKTPVFVVDPKSSPVLTAFLDLDPPPLIDPKNKNFFRDENLIKIPGIPKELDSLSHLSRLDSSNDANFYADPRLVTHIDDYAINAVTEFYGEHLKNG
jgi:hypothetical protein